MRYRGYFSKPPRLDKHPRIPDISGMLIQTKSEPLLLDRGRSDRRDADPSNRRDADPTLLDRGSLAAGTARSTGEITPSEVEGEIKHIDRTFSMSI